VVADHLTAAGTERSRHAAGHVEAHFVEESPLSHVLEGSYLRNMVEHEDASFVAECFWPGVAADDLDALDRRVRKGVAELARGGVARPLSRLDPDDRGRASARRFPGG